MIDYLFHIFVILLSIFMLYLAGGIFSMWAWMEHSPEERELKFILMAWPVVWFDWLVENVLPLISTREY